MCLYDVVILRLSEKHILCRLQCCRWRGTRPTCQWLQAAARTAEGPHPTGKQFVVWLVICFDTICLSKIMFLFSIKNHVSAHVSILIIFMMLDSCHQFYKIAPHTNPNASPSEITWNRANSNFVWHPWLILHYRNGMFIQVTSNRVMNGINTNFIFKKQW